MIRFSQWDMLQVFRHLEQGSCGTVISFSNLIEARSAGAGAISRKSEGRNLFAERGCCRRQSHSVYIGHDISGSPVSLDVGMCRSHCLSQSINSHQSGFPGFSKHSSMLDFLRTKKLQDRQMELPLSTGAERSCPLDSHCEPTRVHVERVLLFEGVQEVEVIEACQCNTSPEECLRLPSLKTFFPDTPLEFTVDVGKCSNPAHARGGLFCAPIKFDCVLIKSPSGVEVVQTLENCEMKETCYRVSYVEYYYEIIHNSAGDSEERLTEIDVGRCLGSCTSGNHCLLRDSQNGEKCLIWAEGASSHCVPHQYNTHTFKSRSGNIRTVFAIQKCKCGSY
ncbi:uncharacterized protein LOC119848477 [Dermochelys coriacea]|uniref:uncharacterized protein LOC119848477 n=1 Tax=Dermochelys coriacea TaxID=27794 RepID=UPI001CA85566|nr:uncharacterized protein LOC119848477 [Dermochelys coriacea]